MDVNVESSGGLQRQMHVRVPAERVALAVAERLNQYARRAKLPGFRPGKAPRKVIEQQFGPSAQMDAVSDIVQQTYPEALDKAGVNPAGQPKIDITTEGAGVALEYVAHFEVYPEVVLKPFSELRIERPQVEITEDDIDRLIENLRKARREFESVERAAETGDRVTLDFVGRVDGEAFLGGEGKDVVVELGAGRFLPDLENGIVGHAAAETAFTVEVSFPEDYRAEMLRGKTAQFEVTLKKVEVARMPQIDAAFLEAHGVDADAGEAGLREKCRTALTKERDKGVAARLKQQVMDQLLAVNPLELPQALVQQEIPRLREEAAARMNMAGVGADRLQQLLPDASFEETARRRVALGMLIGEALRSLQIQLDAQRVEQALEGVAADYETPEQVKAYYRGRKDLMQGLSAAVMEDQVVDAIVAQATISPVELALDTLLAETRS